MKTGHRSRVLLLTRKLSCVCTAAQILKLNKLMYFSLLNNYDSKLGWYIWTCTRGARLR